MNHLTNQLSLQNIEFRQSPNHRKGRMDHAPDFIVLHTTSGPEDRAPDSGWNTAQNPSSGVSYHFVIRRDGMIRQAVKLEDTAWAAGTRQDGGNLDPMHSTNAIIRERRHNANLYTINIAFEQMLRSNPSAEQMDAVVALIRQIRQRYDIPLENIIGHGHIAPRLRLDCPGRSFPFGEVVSRLDSPTTPELSINAPNLDEPQERRVTLNVLGEVQDIGGYIEDGITYVRLREIAAAMGYAAEWDEVRNIPMVTNIAESPAIEFNPIPRQPIELTDFQLEALCKIVWAEARGEDDFGQRLVVHVVLNRMASPAFPDNLLEVFSSAMPLALSTTGHLTEQPRTNA